MQRSAVHVRQRPKFPGQENPAQQTERKPFFDLRQLLATPGALTVLNHLRAARPESRIPAFAICAKFDLEKPGCLAYESPARPAGPSFAP
jgi:hypothetical protein